MKISGVLVTLSVGLVFVGAEDHVRSKRHKEYVDAALQVIKSLTGKKNDQNREVECLNNDCGRGQENFYAGQPNYYQGVPNYYPYPYPQYVPNTYPGYQTPYPYPYPQNYNQNFGQPQPDYQVNVHRQNNQKPANININIPQQHPSNTPSYAPNINNVIYGPSPPSTVNNNFYSPNTPQQNEDKNKFCNPNTEFNCYNGRCLSDPLLLCDGKNDCGNRVDEVNCNHINFSLDLIDEDDSSEENYQQQRKSEGIVQVSVKGQKGCICNRNFDIHDADVVCKELGFKKGCEKINRVSGSKGGRLYPEGIPYLMDNLNCFGNESSIKDCDFGGWGRVDSGCGRRNIVSVRCKTDQDFSQRPLNPFNPAPASGLPTVFCPGNQFTCKSSGKCIPIDRICDQLADCEDRSDETLEGCNVPVQVRLMNGRSVNEGRVEIRVHGIWGTICDRNFGPNEAGVICRTLGFLGQPQIMNGTAFGEGLGPIWLDQLSCPSSDTCCLTSCNNLTWGRSTSCSHNQDVGVRCSNLLRYN